MLHLRFSRRLLRWLGVVSAVLALLAAAWGLGDRLTPRDAAGHPLLLSPSVHAAEKYRRTVLRWVAAMAAVDQRETELLNRGEISDPAQLYDLSRAAESLTDQARTVVGEVVFTPVPPALVALRDQAQAAATATLEATLAATEWVGAPEPERRRAALEALRTARSLRLVLEQSPWLRRSWS